MHNLIKVWKLSPGSPSGVIQVMMQPVPTSLDEATQKLPSGGYTTLRTYNEKKTLPLVDHFMRLQETARLSGLLGNRDMVSVDWTLVRKALRHTVEEHLADEKRIRIILDLTSNPGDIYLLIEPLTIPGEKDYRCGVHVITRVMHRSNPGAKVTNFIEKASSVREELSPGINEVLMISDGGTILEGLSSNFFGVYQDKVFTSGEGILSGITRSSVIAVVEQLRISLWLQAFPLSEIQKLEEAFITSASRGVLPVTYIDGNPVGDGNVGNVTRRIMAGYQSKIEGMLELI